MKCVLLIPICSQGEEILSQSSIASESTVGNQSDDEDDDDNSREDEDEQSDVVGRL